MRIASADALPAARRVLSSEPAVVLLIVSFVPVAHSRRRGSEDSESETDDENAASNAARALHQVVAVSRAAPGLGALLGPANVRFWREMVLRHFDFTVDAHTAFNVEVEDDDPGECLEKIRGEARASKLKWTTHPVKRAVDAWRKAHDGDDFPEQYLDESLMLWETLGVYYRESEYGFLGTIQQDMTHLEAQWPAHEDAFSLYCDLLVVQQLARNEYEYSTWAENIRYTVPCLLGRFDGAITAPGYDMLKFCRIAPQFWYGHPLVTEKWTGLDGDPPHVDHESLPDGETDEEREYFPLCMSKRVFVELRRLVYDRCVDWRRVHLKSEPYESAEFYIGKSKKSQRWFGLVGENDSEYGRDDDEEDVGDDE